MDRNKRLVSGTAIGICFTIAFGFALHNFALGIGLGIIFGVAFSQTDKPKSPKDK